MATNLTQRFLTGLAVYDTWYGKTGNIVAAFLDTTAVPPLAPLYTGEYFVVEYADGVRQTFTSKGKRIDHTLGTVLPGVTLLTSLEYTAVLGAGYPGA